MFREGHVGVVEVAVDPVQRCAEELGCNDAVFSGLVNIREEQLTTENIPNGTCCKEDGQRNTPKDLDQPVMLLLPRRVRILGCVLRVVISLHEQTGFVWVNVVRRGIPGCNVLVGCPLAEVTHYGGDRVVVVVDDDGRWGGVECSAVIRMETTSRGRWSTSRCGYVAVMRCNVEGQQAGTTVDAGSEGSGIIKNSYTGRKRRHEAD